MGLLSVVCICVLASDYDLSLSCLSIRNVMRAVSACSRGQPISALQLLGFWRRCDVNHFLQ
jgi:hypothetical protein